MLLEGLIFQLALPAMALSTSDRDGIGTGSFRGPSKGPRITRKI